MAWMRQDTPGPGTRMPDPPVDVVRERKAAGTKPAARIGKSVFIKGEVRGEEDLIIDGTVEGKVTLKTSRLTIGSSGKIQAEIRARWIVLSGEVNGDVIAGDRVDVTDGGRVNGDIHAPRLVVAEGAIVNGSIDMDPLSGSKKAGRSEPAEPPVEQEQEQEQAAGQA